MFEKNLKKKKIPVKKGASHEGEQDADAAHELNETAQDPAHVCTGDFDYVNCCDGQLKTKTHTTEKPMNRIEMFILILSNSNSRFWEISSYSHFDTFKINAMMNKIELSYKYGIKMQKK